MSHFQGMSLREIEGMPLTAEATGVALSYLIPASQRRYRTHPMQLRIALRQERYVREVLLRCPWWRPRKMAKLRQSLAYAGSAVRLTLLASTWRMS